MKNRTPHIILLILLFPFFVQAKFVCKDKEVQVIVEKGALLAQTYLANDKKSLKGLVLLKFVRAHNPYHSVLGLIDVAEELGREVEEPKELYSPKSYAKILFDKAKKIEKASGSEEQMFLYVYMSSVMDSNLEVVQKELKRYKEVGLDPVAEFDYLLENLPDDLLTESSTIDNKQQVVDDYSVKLEEKKVELEEDPYKRYEQTEELPEKKVKPVKVEEIKSIIDESHFEYFSYSQRNVLEAINDLVERMASHKIKLSFKSDKVSIVEVEESLDGTKFYYGPRSFSQRGYDFSLNGYDLRDVMDHICIQNELDYVMRDGEVLIRDIRYHNIKGQPQDGWDLEKLYPLFKDQYLKTKNKYKQKFVKVQAFATGVRFEGYLNKNAKIILNGGAGFIELKPGEYHEDRLRYLAEEISILKREKDLELSVYSRKGIKDSTERKKGKYKWNSNVELTFFAKVKNIDHAHGMQFESPRFLYQPYEEHCISIRYPNENDALLAKERKRL